MRSIRFDEIIHLEFVRNYRCKCKRIKGNGDFQQISIESEKQEKMSIRLVVFVFIFSLCSAAPVRRNRTKTVVPMKKIDLENLTLPDSFQRSINFESRGKKSENLVETIFSKEFF